MPQNPLARQKKNAPPLLSLDQLRPAEYNPRSIKPEAAEGLATSMLSFGDISGIVWNARTGNLVCGHQRVKQSLELGAQLEHPPGEAPCLVLPNGEYFPIKVVDWELSKEHAANISANSPGLMGDFTIALPAFLDELKTEISEDLFEAFRLDDLLGSLSKTFTFEINQELTYSIIVDFKNEGEQKEFLEILELEGYKCRLLIT